MKKTVFIWITAGGFLILLMGGCGFFSKRTLSADPESARQVNEIRLATEKYRDIDRAQADGYFRASGYIPNLGYQYANPKLFSKFELQRPPILLYDDRDGQWDLTGVAYVAPFDKNPKTFLPFKKAEYKKQPMICRYLDGTSLEAPNMEACPKEHPITHAALGLWHPDIWIMSAWVWYPNPNGLFSLFNPLLTLG
jgi:hypothetical protein